MFYVYLYLFVGVVFVGAMDYAFGYRLRNKLLTTILLFTLVAGWLPMLVWGLVIAFKNVKEERTKNT